MRNNELDEIEKAILKNGLSYEALKLAMELAFEKGREYERKIWNNKTGTNGDQKE
jgi:hypothetical protein